MQETREKHTQQSNQDPQCEVKEASRAPEAPQDLLQDHLKNDVKNKFPLHKFAKIPKTPPKIVRYGSVLYGT
eukprot:2613638-Karenia_brevis.AAC.1